MWWQRWRRWKLAIYTTLALLWVCFQIAVVLWGR
jgi:hypothetical protein